MPRTRLRICSLYVTELDHKVRGYCSMNIAFTIFSVWVLPTLVAQVFMTLVIRGSRLMPCSVFQRKVLLAPVA